MPAPSTATPTIAAHPGVFVQKKSRDGREQRFCAPLQMPSAVHSQVPVITPVNVTVHTTAPADPAGSRPMTPTTPSSTHTVHNPYSVASNADEFDAFEQITPTSGSISSIDERMAALQQPHVSPSPSPMSPYGPAYGPPVSPTGHMVGGFGMPQYPRYTVPAFPHAAPSPYGVPTYPAMPSAVPVIPGYGRMMAGTPTSMDGVVGYPSSPVVSAAHMHMVGAYGLPVSGPATPTTPIPMHAAPAAVFDGSVPATPAASVDANAAGDNEAKKAKRRRKRRAQEENTAVDAIRYKTKLCKNWQTTNRCPYGPRCLFAHGGRELRTCDTNTDAIVLASAMAQPEDAFYSVGRFPNFVPVPRDLLGVEGGELMMADNVDVPAVLETQQA